MRDGKRGTLSADAVGAVQRLACIALATAFCACAAPPPPPPQFPCLISSRPFKSFLVPNVPARVQLRLAVSCPEGTPTPKFDGTFTSAVRDPDNRVVAHTGEVDSEMQFNSVGVVLSFTPDRPGTWYLTATLNPDVGIAQGVIQVVEWRGDAPVRTVDWPTHPACDAVDVTASGLAVCFRNVGDGFRSKDLEWVVHRPGSADEAFPAVAAAVAGDSVWSIRAGMLERRVDQMGRMVLSHSATLPSTSNGPPSSIVAREREAWVLDDRQVLHATSEMDAGFSIEARPVFAPGSAETLTPAALVASPDALLLLGEYKSQFQAFFPSGLDGGFGQEQIGPIHLGSDSETIWVNAFQELVALAPGDAGFRKATLLLPENSAFGFASVSTRGHTRVIPIGPGVPRVNTVPRLMDGRILLELFDAGASFGPVEFASRQHAFAWSLDGGQLRIFDR